MNQSNSKDTNFCVSIPPLRFPEFSGDWESKKLREISEINPSNISLPDKFIYIDLESVNDGELTKEEIVNKTEAPSRAQRILEKEDIIFQMVRPYQKNNLFFDRSGLYVASTGYAQIRTKQTSRFLYQYLHFQKFVNRVIERCTGTSYPAINSTDLSNISISFPTLPEQQKIATFLTAVDDKLTQLKKKKILLEQYKKGLMPKIFSQEIRFKDNNGKAFPEWEIKRLEELDIFISDGNYGELYPKSNEMKIKGVAFIRANNIKNLKQVWNDMKFIDVELHNILLSGHLKTNDVLVTTRGDIGMVAYVTNEFDGSNINAQICLLRAGENLNSFYLLQFLASDCALKQFKNLQTGSALKQLPKSSLGKIKIDYPSLAEQTKIANFLSAIDEKINHCNTQIEKTNQYKKGLLQMMFV